MLSTLIAIAIGAAAGALSRYLLSVQLNHIFEDFNLGTLMANLIGCYLIGLVMGSTLGWINQSPQIRAMVIIGFLGSFTTFSSFSIEVIELMQSAKYWMATLKLGLHVFGSLFATLLGIMTIQTLSQGNI